MSQIRISQAAQLLGVSDDTVRRWADAGKVETGQDASGRQVIDGASLAAFAEEQAATKGPDALDSRVGHRSARNHLTGLVVDVQSDKVMSQVELQCGPYRVVSLISTEAVRELGLKQGSVATAVIKATNVTIEA
ncbi:MAG: helix-turn-helix transcriptional regulator [Propionibacteriaceae bacterium]|nr:helix-turn-helix transcriptional regulator [Propionibacteriaceae bacterium]